MNTETPDQVRAAERARCAAELLTHSAERMASAMTRYAGGDRDALATVRYASAIEQAARLLESGELTLPAAPAPATRLEDLPPQRRQEVAGEIIAHLQAPALARRAAGTDLRLVDGPNGGA
ncbi:hypothetical protein [Streptosporangium sp. NPDC002721]|uniref:hypothetical protein n=1 Tax=Streptosporangium sp. NPDC002721 TaxID=3366188 RepID=UPI00369B787F